MPQQRPSLLVTAACVVACAAAARLCAPLSAPLSAQTLPSTATTSAPAATAAPAYQTPPPAPVQRARVQLSGGLVSVAADNTSLNQVLAEIARLTGMTITGGVVEQHIYGNYGPADPGTVLTALLSGSGSNMLLIQTGANTRQLILTPRNGGPTPPSPSPPARLDDDLPPQQTPRVDNRLPPGRRSERQNEQRMLEDQPQPPSPPPGPPPDGTVAPSASDAVPQPPAPVTTTEQSPNGVKTPQQIYEQLMKLQQQNDKTAPQ